MRKALPVGEYTQLNTNADEYLIQNLSTYILKIVIADSQPATTVEPDFLLDPKCGISNSHFAQLCWGRPEGKYPITVGIVEG